MSLPFKPSVKRLAVAGIAPIAALVYALHPGEAAPVSAPKATPSASVELDLVAPREAEPEPQPKPATMRSAVRPQRAAAQPLAPAGSQQRTALIVGINKAAGAEPLAGAVPDAKNIRAALLRYGFLDGNIKMLLDGEATRPAILSELRSLASRTSPSGIAVFGLAAHSGTSSFRTFEGARIAASELATHLGAVRGRMWNVLSTCYAGGYAIPGVVGPGRIATFSSSAQDLTWEMGSAGTYLVRSMVNEAMTSGRAASSVEAAYNYSKKKDPSRAPIINDGVSGELVLGPVTWGPPPPPKTAPKPAIQVPQVVPTPVPTPKPKCSGLLGCLLGGLLQR